MKEIIEKSLCTGCTACVNACPKNAIEMKFSKEGFKYPVIDNDKCIDCRLCKKTCPVLNTQNNKSINKCFVGYAKENDVKKNASSGGIFPLVANYVLNNNGIVIGAAFTEYNKLEHIAIEKKEELYKLKGSKYLQSDLGDIFKFIKEKLNEKKILFVGVPCQVAGLKAFLKKDYDNLICIDLICHGVPSPKLFKKYVNELEEKHNSKLLNYNFRDKSTGWDNYSNTAIFENSEMKESHEKNKYMKLFLSDVALRESCFNCKFKLHNKYSDCTLGDFWGVNNYYPEMYNKKGVSAIVVNTEKGRQIFEIVKSEIECKECKLEEILKGNPSLEKSSSIPLKRNDFFENIDNLTIEEMVNQYTIKSKNNIVRRVLGKIKRIIKGITRR